MMVTGKASSLTASPGRATAAVAASEYRDAAFFDQARPFLLLLLLFTM